MWDPPGLGDSTFRRSLWHGCGFGECVQYLKVSLSLYGSVSCDAALPTKCACCQSGHLRVLLSGMSLLQHEALQPISETGYQKRGT